MTIDELIEQRERDEVVWAPYLGDGTEPSWPSDWEQDESGNLQSKDDGR